jgi:hypothetical protein
MNQSVQIDLASVMPAVRASGLQRSLCTIQTPPESDTFGESGAMDPATPWTDLADHVDIACIASPLETSDSMAQLQGEVRTMPQIMVKLTKHVLLDDCYPLILAEYRAVVDGVAYNITKAEPDSQAKMTRLALELVTI